MNADWVFSLICRWVVEVTDNTQHKHTRHGSAVELMKLPDSTCVYSYSQLHVHVLVFAQNARDRDLGVHLLICNCS